MAGPKKNQRKDFQKVKLKVGRIVKRGLNFTETSFKSKKIVLRNQLKGEAKDVKDQYLSALSKLNSSNKALVIDGLRTLSRLVVLLNSDRRQSVLKCVGILASNVDVEIRLGSTSVLDKILATFSAEQREAFSERLLLNLQCALTSLDWRVKKDGLELLTVLFKYIPDSVSKCYPVMENVLDLVSSTKEDLSSRKLDMELKSHTSHLKLWGDVSEVLTKIVLRIMKLFFSKSKPVRKCCSNMASLSSRVRWFTGENSTSTAAIHLKGNAVANAVIPVLIEMWSGVESFEATSNVDLRKVELFSKIALLMVSVAEWADLMPNADFKALPEQALTFFKSRFPVTVENVCCANVNLRLAKFLITLHRGKNLALNKTLFLELKQHPEITDIKLLLEVATKAVKDTPDVVEYVNSLFFTKKTQTRRAFYAFYLKVCSEIVGDFHVNRMLLKITHFTCRIIVQYPQLCEDEVNFLENVHSLMLPAYIDGLEALSLSTLEEVLRITHPRSRLGLRLILDQSNLRADHLKIILDLWNEGRLTPDDMLFVVGRLEWKLDEVWSIIINEPGNQIAIDLHVELVNLISEFYLTFYLDLDDFQRPRIPAEHPLQPKMRFLKRIHKTGLRLKNVTDCERRMFAASRHLMLKSAKMRTRVVELLWTLFQVWYPTSKTIEMSSLTLSNMLLLMNHLELFGEDIIDPFDKLVNQLVVAEHLPMSSERRSVLDACAEYLKVYGTDSFMQDLDEVMNADPDDFDDKLHMAFAESVKWLRDLKLLQRNDFTQDFIEDSMKLAEVDSGQVDESDNDLDLGSR